MPKKTKRQKILAQLHRETYSFRPLSQPTSQSTEPSPTIQQTNHRVTFTANTLSSTSIPSSKFELAQGALAIQKDLTKTVLLAGVIIVTEFILARYLP